MASSERETSTPSLRQALPALHEAQSAYLAAMDSLRHPDRKTHELIRLACTVILRNGPGVRRHAMLAAEFGASWEDIVGTLVLTQPGFGFIPAMEALPHARHGYEEGVAAGVADLSQLDADDD